MFFFFCSFCESVGRSRWKSTLRPCRLFCFYLLNTPFLDTIFVFWFVIFIWLVFSSFFYLSLGKSGSIEKIIYIKITPAKVQLLPYISTTVYTFRPFQMGVLTGNLLPVILYRLKYNYSEYWQYRSFSHDQKIQFCNNSYHQNGFIFDPLNVFSISRPASNYGFV